MVIPALTLVAVAAAWAIFHTTQPAPASGTTPAPMPRNPAIESTYGIRFSHVAVTAGGGMLDVRFLVLDSEKAQPVGHSPKTFPVIVDQQTGRVISGLAMAMWPHNPKRGYQYFLIYRNDGGTVASGDKVSIKVGSSWLRGITVR
jgi:hypothetical protein